MDASNTTHIAVVTSSRADWNHLVWPLRRLQEHPGVRTSLIVTGAHLAPTLGMTVNEIQRAGFTVDERIECLLASDTDVAMARAIGFATASFAETLGRLRPDLLLVIADRYEMLAPANAALALRIPLAHIEGGERSEGAIDHAVRNALTMMSHVHFTTTERAAERVASMGEEPWRVHRVGAPSLDHLVHSTLMTRDETERVLGIDLATPPLVAAFHPVTLDDDPADEAEAFFSALASVSDRPIVFCSPNADAGRHRIADRMRAFCSQHDHAQLRVNLEPLHYWSLLRHAAAMAGNSSSGVMESTSLRLPAVNVGRRQHGREHAANVLTIPAETEAIIDALQRVLTPAFRAEHEHCTSPYGDGNASARIAAVLAELPDRATLLNKQMTDDLPVITPTEVVPGR